jgi:hypothetical protein
LNTGSEGDDGTGSDSAILRGAGEIDRAGRPSTDNSRERPVSTGVGISEGLGEKEGNRGRDSCVGVAVGDTSSGDPSIFGWLSRLMDDICVEMDASDCPVGCRVWFSNPSSFCSDPLSLASLSFLAAR